MGGPGGCWWCGVRPPLRDLVDSGRESQQRTAVYSSGFEDGVAVAAGDVSFGEDCFGDADPAWALAHAGDGVVVVVLGFAPTGFRVAIGDQCLLEFSQDLLVGGGCLLAEGAERPADPWVFDGVEAELSCEVGELLVVPAALAAGVFDLADVGESVGGFVEQGREDLFDGSFESFAGDEDFGELVVAVLPAVRGEVPVPGFFGGGSGADDDDDCRDLGVVCRESWPSRFRGWRRVVRWCRCLDAYVSAGLRVTRCGSWRASCWRV